jgi:hypothetical protein
VVVTREEATREHVATLITVPIDAVIGSYVGLLIALEESNDVSPALMHQLTLDGALQAPVIFRAIEAARRCAS